MEAAALEQALRARPDDAATWLVYGDWLLEHGDARGTLIQLEHRLARAKEADRPALRRKLDALVRKHQASWRAGWPPAVAACAWRYGFVTKIAVTWFEGAPAWIARALQEPFVTALRIVPPGQNPGGKDGIEGNAAGYDGEEEGEEEEEEEEEEYDEDGNPIPPPIVDIGAIATIDLSRLVALELPYVHLGAPGAEVLAAVPSLGGLEALDLRYAGIGDDGVAALAASPHLGGLRRLHLQQNGITAAGAKALARFARLAELDLRYNPLGEAGARALLEAPFIGQLARLSLYRADVTDVGAQELATSSRLAPALRGYWRST